MTPGYRRPADRARLRAAALAVACGGSRLKDNELRRRELADFLRTRRARLSPEACGLAGQSRRRIAGLRREEVAGLAGVSPSWYTKLEQGRDIRISVRFLKNLAGALKLSSVERAQLFELALFEPVLSVAPGTGELVPALQRMIDSMPISPAFILTARGDYLGSNAAADRVMGRYSNSPHGRNLLISLFLDEAVRQALPGWDASARYQVAVFRAAYGRNAGDPRFVALVELLSAHSQDFKRLWEAHEMPSQSTRTVLYGHPTLGQLQFEYFTFYADLDTNLRVDIFTPLDAFDSRRKVSAVIEAARAMAT